MENTATAVGLLGCSLEVMTESIFSNKTTSLQRYFEDNELSKTYLTTKPPTDCSLYQTAVSDSGSLADGSSKPKFKKHPNNVWAWSSKGSKKNLEKKLSDLKAPCLLETYLGRDRMKLSPDTVFYFSPLNHLPLMTTSIATEMLHKKRCSR